MQSSFSFSFIFDNQRSNNFPKYMFYRCALKKLSLLHKLICIVYLLKYLTTTLPQNLTCVQYVAKSIATCKKKSLYNQPKLYFFKKLLRNHFCIDFNKFYTKTFRIVYILTVYLLIMFI
jgi:hypothetical protein